MKIAVIKTDCSYTAARLKSEKNAIQGIIQSWNNNKDRNATDTLRLKQQQQRQSSVNAQGNEGKFRE